jgi:hypothetical protein
MASKGGGSTGLDRVHGLQLLAREAMTQPVGRTVSPKDVSDLKAGPPLDPAAARVHVGAAMRLPWLPE